MIIEEFNNKWKEFVSEIHRTLTVYNKNDNVEICALCGVNADKLGEHIKQFISDLRKKDEEELIKIWRDNCPSNVAFINFEQLIKDYYNK